MPNRRPAGSNTVAIVIGVSVAALVVVGIVTWRGREADNRYTFVGDSITDQARGDIKDRFGVDDRRLQAVPGKTIDEMMPAGRRLAEARPDQAVINLGTNDVLQGQPVEANARELVQMADYFRDAACVHVVTINEHMISNLGHDANALSVGLNQKIREWAAGAPNRRVVDWAEIVNRYDAAGTPEGPITFDTVHTTPLGQQKLLDAYQRSIDSCPPARG